MKDETKVKTFIGIWAAWVVICLGLMAAAVYVAWHFIQKYW